MHQKRPKPRWVTLAAILTRFLTTLSRKLPFTIATLISPGTCEKSHILVLIKGALSIMPDGSLGG